ncbi:MAG: NitT/TauT family transport system permease protein [Chloroflexota bacterium]|nr:NitT/TauT family transport system permease protein [Chloroflexota bacterium]
MIETRIEGSGTSGPATRGASAGRPRTRLLSGVGRGLLPFVGLAVILVVWQLVTSIFTIPSYQLPTPIAVARALVDNRATLWGHALYTGSAVLFGLGISTGAGIVVGGLLSASRTLSSIVMPILVVSQALPKIAVAPLLIVWLGLGFTNEVALAAAMSIFPVIINTAVGLTSVPTELRHLARSAGGRRIRSFAKINVRHAMPSIIAGTKVAATLAVVGAIVGEFVASNSGLGYYLLLKSSTAQMAVVFADLVVLSAVTMFFYFAINLIDALLRRVP